MPLEIRSIGSGEGTPFVDYVQAQVGRRPAQRVLAFLQEWDVLSDELGREPTLDEYQRRWGTSRATAYNDQRLFQQAFPGERTPRRILKGLWALRRNEFGALLSALVADTGGQGELVESGQIWLADDGQFFRLKRLDGSRIHGEVQDGRDGWRPWSNDREALDHMRLAGNPAATVWRVAFQMDASPSDLLSSLRRAGFVVDRFASPDLDWDGGNMRAGVIEARVAAEDRESVRRKLLAIPEFAAGAIDTKSLRVRRAEP